MRGGALAPLPPAAGGFRSGQGWGRAETPIHTISFLVPNYKTFYSTCIFSKTNNIWEAKFKRFSINAARTAFSLSSAPASTETKMRQDDLILSRTGTFAITVSLLSMFCCYHFRVESKSISEPDTLGHASLGVCTARLHKDLVRGPYSVDTWAGIRPGKATRGALFQAQGSHGAWVWLRLYFRTNNQLINFFISQKKS